MPGQDIPTAPLWSLIRFAERERDGVTEIDATIYCEKDSPQGIIIAKGGPCPQEDSLHSGPAGDGALPWPQGVPPDLGEGEGELAG